MLYQWKTAVKFGGITSGFQWYTSKILVALPVVSSGIPVEHQWYTSGNPLFIFGGITTVLPLKSVIPPNFTADFHWYITGNSRDIFYGVVRLGDKKFIQGRELQKDARRATVPARNTLS